jgi:predicted permease
VNSRWTGSPTTNFVSYPLYRDLRENNGLLSGLYANGTANDPEVVIGSDPLATPEHPEARLVSGNYFSVLEVPAYLGRTLAEDDDQLGAPNPVAVISYRYWDRRFGKDRGVIGSVIRVNGAPITIVGVAPPRFSGDIVGQPTDVWLPITLQPRLSPRANSLENRQVSWLVLMGRLAPGVTLERARAVLPVKEAQAIRAHLSGVHLQRFEEDLKESPIRIDPGARGFSRQREVYGQVIVALMAAVLLVILVVCANVSNLMLARGLARVREMTLRMTLGAGRKRLVQQLLIESLVLSVAAGLLGLGVASWGTAVLLRMAEGQSPVVLDVSPNGTILAFTAGATIVCLVLFGLVPAWRATRVDLATALRGQTRSVGAAGARPGRVPLTAFLVGGQIVLSTVLLIASGLLVRSVANLLHTDLGMDRDHLVVAHVATSRSGYVGSRLLAFQRAVLDRVRQIPGIDAASYSLGGPFSGGDASSHVTVPGFVAQADSEGEVHYDYVGPDYFRAMGARVVRGRDFTAADIDGKAKVAAIDATMARYYFAGRDPLGRTVTTDDGSYTIIGVVADIEYTDVRAEPVRRLYLPDADSVSKPRSFELQLHVRGDPGRYVEPVRQAINSLDRTVPIEVSPLADRVKHSVAQDTLLMQVTTFFGVVALVLAALGLYGVTAYATTQRTSEFGLRAALGAETWRVAAMVLRGALRVALCGIAIGIPIGVLAARLLRGTLVGVSPLDPVSLGATVVLVVVAAVVASYVPAWRASRVSPLEALKAGQ